MSTVLNNFVVAAASYFGLPLDQLMPGSTLDTSMDDMELVLRIKPTMEDVEGIAKRMGVLRVEHEVDQAQAAKAQAQAEAEEPSVAMLRAQYNSLPAAQKSAFGSFGRYVAACEQGALEAQARKAQEPPRTGLDLPAHVWVPGSELTGPQMALAMSSDASGRFAMDPNDLTKEQLKEWGPK